MLEINIAITKLSNFLYQRHLSLGRHLFLAVNTLSVFGDMSHVSLEIPDFGYSLVLDVEDILFKIYFLI